MSKNKHKLINAIKEYFMAFFCYHDWEEKRTITLDTALKTAMNLTQFKAKKSDVFYDRTILVYQCKKCKKLKFWKS